MSGETKDEREQRVSLEDEASGAARALAEHFGPKGIRFILVFADGAHIGYASTLDRSEATRILLDWCERQGQ